MSAGRMQGQVGLVTGAASGIGEAVALRLGTEGATVICLDINDAEPVARQIGDGDCGNAEAHLLNVTGAAGWTRITEGVAARHGRTGAVMAVDGGWSAKG